MSSKKAIQRSRSFPKRSSVQRLHGGPDQAGHQTKEYHKTGECSHSVSLPLIGNLHEFMKTKSDSEIFGRSISSHMPSCTTGCSMWFGFGNEFRGNGFTLRVRNQHDGMSNNEHVVCVREENPAPFMKAFDDSSLGEIASDSDVHPMFHIEIEASGSEMSQDGVNMQLMFSTEVDQDMKYLILHQETGSTHWCNITDKCSTRKGSPKVNIPVKKSGRIWVIRLKKSLSSLGDALLALIHGQILFHILVYYQRKIDVVKVRVIGISEELYQNPKGLRTAVTVAEENYRKCEECAPEQLLKKGSLKVEIHKASHCVSSSDFDIGRRTTNKHAEWHDYRFDLNELEDNPEVKVLDKEGEILWCIDLTETICDDEADAPVELKPMNQHRKPVESKQRDRCANRQTNRQPGERPVNEHGRPEITSFADEVEEQQIPWLSRQLNKDVEKVAMLLQVDSVEIEAIKQKGPCVEQANNNILLAWLRREESPTWKSIEAVLENDDVRRFDIIRSLLGEDELISNQILLWLMPRIAADFQMYGRVLGVPECEIDMLSQGCQDHGEKCFSVLKRWRQRTRTPTIDVLIQALDDDIIGRHDLAKEMEKKFREGFQDENVASTDC